MTYSSAVSIVIAAGDLGIAVLAIKKEPKQDLQWTEKVNRTEDDERRKRQEGKKKLA